MYSVPKLADAAWTPVQWLLEWRRKIGERNGTDDARRAQAARLFTQQAGPPIGDYPCREWGITRLPCYGKRKCIWGRQSN